jgi:hypothetical protein
MGRNPDMVGNEKAGRTVLLTGNVMLVCKPDKVYG